MSFSIESKKGETRAGKLSCQNGVVLTPFFMPIATKGAVKHVFSQELLELGAEIILSNTFHLFLRPGHELIARSGNLHKFMNWEKPILTDSGGYQVFSLAKIRTVTENGIEFKSPINGDKHFLTPELAIDIQLKLGSDIIMVLDECISYPATKEQAKEAMMRTSRWAKRSYDHFKKLKPDDKTMLFGIVQGSVFEDLREQSLDDLKEIGFDGYAIGGLAVGEPVEEMFAMLKFLLPKLPSDKPRYLMGVGKPRQIAKAVSLGIDMFDCVIPTRNARHGTVYVTKNKSLLSKKGIPEYEIKRMKTARWQEDFSLVETNSRSPLNKLGIKSAYLRHLFQIDEPLAQRLATLQNLWFYLTLMKELRKKTI